MSIKDNVKRYILYTINCTNKLNEYVPNSHIGITFSEVYEFIEYYNSGEHTNIFNKYDFTKMVEEVFSGEEILTDGIVHNSYQILREKRNDLRNIMMLLMIEHQEDLMPKRVSKGMFKIYEKFKQDEYHRLERIKKTKVSTTRNSVNYQK